MKVLVLWNQKRQFARERVNTIERDGRCGRAVHFSPSSVQEFHTAPGHFSYDFWALSHNLSQES
jgi:hypothetical protein